jgi:hypothetical protein
MRVDLFDFELPTDRIALRPARPRDAARLLFVPGQGDFADKGVLDLPDLLEPGDVRFSTIRASFRPSLRAIAARRGSARRCTSGSTCAVGRPSSATASG